MIFGNSPAEDGVAAGVFPYHIVKDERGYFHFNPFDNPEWRGPFDTISELVQEAVCPLLTRQVEQQYVPQPTQQ